MYYLIPADIIALLEAFIVLFPLWLKEVHSVRSGVPGIMPATFKTSKQEAEKGVSAGNIKNAEDVFLKAKFLKLKRMTILLRKQKLLFLGQSVKMRPPPLPAKTV